MGALRSLLSLAWVAGPPVGRLPSRRDDFRGFLHCGGAIRLAILPVLLWFRKTAGAGPQLSPSADEPSRAGGRARPTTARLLLTSAAFVLLQSASRLAVMSMPLFFSVDLHADISGAGLILGLCAALEIPLMLVFGAVAVRRSLRSLVLLGAGIGVAYFAAMALTEAVWRIAVAQILNACFIAAVTGLGISYLQDMMPARLGHATTMFTNTFRFSAMLAGLIFGVVQLYGYRFSYVIGAGLCAGGLALLTFTQPDPPRLAGAPA